MESTPDPQIQTGAEHSALNCSAIGSKLKLSPIHRSTGWDPPNVDAQNTSLDVMRHNPSVLNISNANVMRHNSSVLNVSNAEIRYQQLKPSVIVDDEWIAPNQMIKPARTIPISHKNNQALKFHVPSQYSLHPARSPVAILNLTFEQFDTIFVNVYEIFGSIYTFFAMELSIQQKEELNRSILFPLKSIVEIDNTEEQTNPIITKCRSVNLKAFRYQFHKLKYYFILFGFSTAILMSIIQIASYSSSERSLFNLCCILWFLRCILTLLQQRKCILSAYTDYIRQNNTNSNKSTQFTASSKFNWLEIHLERISSHRSTSEHFNKQFLSYAFVFCGFFTVLSCCILCLLILSNALNLITIPIISEVLLFSTSNNSTQIIYAIWIWFEFVQTICLMTFLMPSFILSCTIVTNRFNNWKNVLDHSNELQFSQIRSYIFQGRYLLRAMNEQWSFYLTILIFTTIPHILLALYTLVLTERTTSAANQLFGWCWFIVIFVECSITCYYGANIHKSFEALSKSVVDLGSRTMIQGDEEYMTPTEVSNNVGSFASNTPKSSSNNKPKDIEENNQNEHAQDKQLRINTKINAAQKAFFSPMLTEMCSNNSRSILKTPNTQNQQLSINLLLLLVSSMNSIDGISVGGIFTLNFGVIAKFLSALFTFGILFIELTRAPA